MSDDADGGTADHARKESFGLSPRGAPDRPGIEALAVLAALYFTAYLPSGSSAIGALIASAAFYLYSIASAVPAILLVLYMMATTDGLGPFRVGPLRGGSVGRAAVLACAALALMAGLGFLLGALGAVNPIWQAGAAAPLALIPLIVLSSAATGYAEELCFRSYLIRRLGQAGLAPGLAVAASPLFFALAHGAQGVPGIAVSGGLGRLFALRFSRRGDLHGIALAHGAYNAVVFVLQLYALPR